jgi:hypothetical protein
MWSFKHSLTNEEIRMLIVACGGVAFLIALAVWITPGDVPFITQVNPEANLAAVVSHTPKVLRLTAVGQNAWTVPDDWNDTNNKIEVIGGGGAGSSGQNSGGGGGGGAYARIANLNLTPGAHVLYQVGEAGAKGFFGKPGGDTWFNSAVGFVPSCRSGISVCANGGQPGFSHTGGVGGAMAKSIGATRYAGGNGASTGGCDTCTGGSDDGDGGGGAAGPSGTGVSGIALGPGGAGDAGQGGAGGVHGCSQGKPGAEWGIVGAGGGGGGGADDSWGCDGGFFGGGGGGKGDDGLIGGAGAQGLIVITYYPSSRSPKPAIDITAGGKSGVVNVHVGDIVPIHATFAPGTGDALVATAISGPAPYRNNLVPNNFNWVSVPSTPSVPPRSLVPYDFHADQSGDFTFIPDVKTKDYPKWDDYNKFVTVHVSCTGACSCPSGQNLVNGICTPGSCPSGQHLVGNVCIPDAVNCTNGFHLVNGVCVANAVTDICLNMPGNQSIVPANCILRVIPAGTACVEKDPGYRVVGTQCLKRGVISSFTATPARLRANDGTTLTWVISGMTGGCSISATSGFEPGSISAGDGTHSVQIAHVSQITIYRLTCSDGVEAITSEKTVTVVPEFEEI